MGLNIQSQSKPSATKNANALPQFLDLEPAKFQELYSIFLSAVSLATATDTKKGGDIYTETWEGGGDSSPALLSPESARSIKDSLTARISSWGLPQKSAIQIASAFYTYCTSPYTLPFLSATIPTSRALVSRQDLEFYIATLNTTPDLSPQIRRVLLAFAAFYRRNYHPKKWVRYDRKSIFFLAGLSDMSATAQEDLTTTLHKEYGFDLRVIGSKSPVPCFYFDWMASQPAPGLDPSNPYIDLGPYAPQTIAATATKTPDELYDLIEQALDAQPLPPSDQETSAQ